MLTPYSEQSARVKSLKKMCIIVHAGCSGINGKRLDAGQGIALDEVHSAPGQRLKPKVQIQSCRSQVLHEEEEV